MAEAAKSESGANEEYRGESDFADNQELTKKVGASGRAARRGVLLDGITEAVTRGD